MWLAIGSDRASRGRAGVVEAEEGEHAAHVRVKMCQSLERHDRGHASLTPLRLKAGALGSDDRRSAPAERAGLLHTGLIST
jgi:hypothetical protein